MTRVPLLPCSVFACLLLGAPAVVLAQQEPADESTAEALPAPVDAPAPLPADGPPEPDAPLPPPVGDPTNAAPAHPPAPPPDAPHPAWSEPEGGKADVARGNDAPSPRARRRVRTVRTTEVCGIPVWAGGPSPLMLAGAAVGGLAALAAGGVGILFLLDLLGAHRMVMAVDRAQARGDALPERCTSYGACRDRYLRAFFLDLGGAAFSLVLSGVLLFGALGLAFAATVLRFGG